jgi:hypothetical protein
VACTLDLKEAEKAISGSLFENDDYYQMLANSYFRCYFIIMFFEIYLFVLLS